RLGNTSSMQRSRSASLSVPQRAISSSVRRQPTQKPCVSSLHTPMHGVSGGEDGCAKAFISGSVTPLPLRVSCRATVYRKSTLHSVRSAAADHVHHRPSEAE